MKKLAAWIMVLVLALSCCAALADGEGPEERECPEEAKFYEGTWENVDAKIEMVWELEGYRVLVTAEYSADKRTEWEYSCLVEEGNKLVSMPFGIRNDIVIDSDGKETCTTAYDDGQAEFFLDEDGLLVWKDEKEDAGKDMLFVKQSPGDYDGYWVCDTCVVEMYWEEEGYKILARQADGSEKEYSAFYHDDDNTVVTVDGDAVFSRSEDGQLVWGDLVLERMDQVDPEAEEEADG